MKSIFKIIIILVLVPCLALAQTNRTAIFVGGSAGSKTVNHGGTNITFFYNLGSPVHHTQVKMPFTGTSDAPYLGGNVTLGFPYYIPYFPKVFQNNFFVSKGFFGGYIQLTWNVNGNPEGINTFKIYRKEYGSEGDSIFVASVSNSTFTYRDDFADKGVLYEYWVIADGVGGFPTEFVNYVKGVGIAMPTANATGRITYAGGNAVEGVRVVAETEGSLGGKSLALSPTNSSHLTIPYDSKMELNTGFTWQGWYRSRGTAPGTLFSKGNIYEVAYDPSGNGNLSFKVGASTANLTFKARLDSFFHITASYSPANSEIKLYVHVTDEIADSVKLTGVAQPAVNTDPIYVGRNSAGNYFDGFVDELRLWKRVLPLAEIKNNYLRYISGQGNGLEGYWRLTEGVSPFFFDIARTGNRYHEHHGTASGASWSNVIPMTSQLGFVGFTNANGNYSIEGFPYATGGSLYTLTPILGVHKFDPNQQQRFVSDGQTVLNDINFTDISSFKVSGTVEYRNTNFPVQGVSILIDGKPAIGAGGVLTTTNNDGYFQVDVPIGLHSLQVAMQGHGFERRGYFVPLGQENADVPLFNYQEPKSGLEFIDTTLVKITGRMVGGVREKAKLLGFGLSNNNIGDGIIKLKADKEKDLVKSATATDSTSMHSEGTHMNTNVTFQSFNVTIKADPATGEFVAFLPPENYTTTDATAGTYTYDASYRTPWNLKTTAQQNEIKKDTAAIVNGNLVGSPRYVTSFDPANYDHNFSFTRNDTLFRVGVDTFYFAFRKDFILRTTPSILITNDEDEELFGEKEYEYTDDQAPNGITIPVITGTTYNFGHPLIIQGKTYTFRAEVFEAYSNGTVIDRVPVSDGKLELVNGWSSNTDAELVSINNLGKATYRFRGGSPNTTGNSVDGDSFTRNLTVTAITGESQNIRTQWNNGQPLKAIVLGGRLQGTGFVTAGPNQIVAILRDPPGSNSYTELERGSTMTKTNAWSVGGGLSTSRTATVSLGADVKTFIGLGAGTIIEAKVEASASVGLEVGTTFNDSGVETSSVTVTKAWSTSSGDGFVGRDGDLFVGYSTNIAYGKAISIQPVRTTSSRCQTGDCAPTAFDGFKIGPNVGLAMNPEYATSFIYTQAFIENELLPNLKLLRNSYLTFDDNPNSVTATTKVLYVTSVPADDPKYGSANSDRAVWQEQASSNIGVGPSYYMKVPASMTGQRIVDSIDYFNEQIENWKYWLAENEKQKIQATFEENISISSGADYVFSRSTTSSEESTFTYGFNIDATLASEIGAEVNGIGAKVEATAKASVNTSNSTTNGTVSTTNYKFVLSDRNSALTDGGNVIDYQSIDINIPKDGHSRSFYLKAGATSCPYEGEQLTKYYQPGQHQLQQATLKHEDVEMQITNPRVSNVPENRPAEINLQLLNNSATEKDVWADIVLDDQSNPDGLILRVDGAPLTGNGRSFLVRYGQTLNKTIRVEKGAASVFDYENVKIQLRSNCTGEVISESFFSVNFQQGCSDVRLFEPVDKWTLNTVTGDTLNITFDQYNLQKNNFKYASLQYKATSSSVWSTQINFYNPVLVSQATFDAIIDAKSWLSETGRTTYKFLMSDLNDRTYDIRVVTYCEISPGTNVNTPSDIHTGIKDMKKPKLFGTPQPADGVLSPGDEISIQFDEALEAGLLGLNNFSITGVLNNFPVAHSSSIGFDGVDNYISMASGLNLAKKSFTVEFWLKRDPNGFGREQVVFSRGNTETDRLNIGFTANDELFVDFADQPRVKSVTMFNTTMGDPNNTAFVPDNLWNHYAISYDHQNHKIYGYRSGTVVLEQLGITRDLPSDGIINVGRAAITNDQHFHGNVHELRIWESFRPVGDVSAKSKISMNGLEIGLVGLWTMDEAFGSLALDKARFRHAQVFADWVVEPRGRAYQFNGSDSYIEISTGASINVDRDQDFTIEFWFKAPAQQNTVMFSSGKGDGSPSDELNSGSWSIGFNQNGRLYVANSGKYITLSGANQDYADNNWHHFALTINRRGNSLVFVDGNQQGSLASNNFGLLAGQYMWLGARGFKVNSTDFARDHFYNGILDEVRIWNLQRKQEQILLDRNSQVNRDVMGLLGYFPFERFITSQGVQQVQTTLADQWLPPRNLPNSGTAVAFGSGTFTETTANIKQARPVSTIDFDYAVNGDKIILTPSESVAAAIEKTILEITVERVQDKNGNRMASPITWTAFIDQNQLKWSTTSITAQKELYANYTFTVDVVNQSGTFQQYNISNLPSWITVSAPSGNLEPLSSKKITFTVDKDLNTGTYRRDIFLTGDFGFDEKLILDLRVFKPIPADWTVNPSDFQFSMNIVGQIKVAGKVSSDLNDMLGAFVNNKCRGVVNLQYIPQFDNYLAFITIYSNTVDPEPIKFKIWDDSEGQVFTQVTPDYTFQPNQSYGRPAAPILFEAVDVVENDVAVPQGWKWISFGLSSNQLSDVNTIMKDMVATNGDQIKGDLYFDSYSATERKWLGTISQNGGFKTKTMYKLKAAQGSKIRFVGQIPDPTLTPIQLVKGWNWIGFISQRNMGVNEALQSFNATDGDIIKSQYQVAIYDQNFGWIGNLQSLIPNEGYMLFSDKVTSFTFPQVSSLSRTHVEDVDYSWWNLGEFSLNPHHYEQQMTVVASVKQAALVNESVRLLALADNKIVGIGMPVMNPISKQWNFFMTIFGGGTTSEIAYALVEEDGTLIDNANELSSFKPDLMLGSIKSPLQLTLGTDVSDALEELQMQVYPNPFVDDLNIEFALDKTTMVEAAVYNVAGQLVNDLVSGNLEKGNHKYTWNSETLPAGMYHLSLVIDGEIHQFKLVKK